MLHVSSLLYALGGSLWSSMLMIFFFTTILTTYRSITPIKNHQLEKEYAKIQRPAKTLPIIGILLETLSNIDRLYDWFYEETLKTTPRPFAIFAPGKTRAVVVSTPQAFEDVLKTQFDCFVKGPDMIDNLSGVLGQGIFAVNGNKWKHQRKTASHLFTMRLLKNSMAQSIEKHIGFLLQVLNRSCDQIDLFKLMNRFTIETFVHLAFGLEMGSLLKEDQEDHPFQSAFDTAQGCLQARFMRPRWFWKFQRWINIGKEADLKKQVEVIDSFVLDIISQALDKRTKGEEDGAQTEQEEETQQREEEEEEHKTRNLVSLFIDHVASFTDQQQEEEEEEIDPKYIRDIVVNFLIAGRDTTAQTISWFFVCLARNPQVADKIRVEIKTKLPNVYSGTQTCPSMEECQQLVYLEAALKETLRLYPSVPANARVAIKDTVLSDGTPIPKDSAVIFNAYVLGRMTHVWGPDALEYMPERWFDPNDTTRQKLITVSPFKFPAFHAGPRTCLGMNLAMMEMKMVVSSVMSRFDIQVQNPEQVRYQQSITLAIKGPLVTKVKKLENRK